MIWINGIRSKQIEVQDRGLQYGDGVWETLAIQQGKAEFLNAHLQRLQLGCQRLSIKTPNLLALKKTIQRRIQSIERAVLKIIVTRGQGGRGYNPIGTEQTTDILSLHPWPNYKKKFYKQGVNTTLCQTRLAYSPQLAGFKHLNRLEQVLARAEWQDQFEEGLMMDYQDRIIEGVMSNLFIVKAGSISTPALDGCGIAGIMRAELISLAQLKNIPVKIRSLTIDDLYAAEGLFLTNSILGVWPVKQFQQKRYAIPAITRQLQSLLTQHRQTMMR